MHRAEIHLPMATTAEGIEKQRKLLEHLRGFKLMRISTYEIYASQTLDLALHLHSRGLIYEDLQTADPKTIVKVIRAAERYEHDYFRLKRSAPETFCTTTTQEDL